MADVSLGSYELLKKLATGGMAEVWLARQVGIEGFQRHVVVKRILPHLAEDPEFVHMFLNEAKIAARFSHPNIAQIYDFGQRDGTYFIAMEFIHGEDLGRIMRKAWSTGQWIARPIAVRIIASCCEGLAYAHSRLDEGGRPLKVVHRDISPQNIIISFDGSVKVVDFGIAKAADQDSNTKSGAIKGKFAYMSPEQAAGKPLDARSDIFSSGLVLYELLTGVRPLKRDAELATLQAALECQIDPPSHVAEVPSEIDPIVMRALAKHAEDRYRDAREFQMALEEFLVNSRQVATSAQVAELMDTLFADRRAEEAKLGSPNPRGADSKSASRGPAGPPVSGDWSIPAEDKPTLPPPLPKGKKPTLALPEVEAPPAEPPLDRETAFQRTPSNSNLRQLADSQPEPAPVPEPAPRRRTHSKDQQPVEAPAEPVAPKRTRTSPPKPSVRSSSAVLVQTGAEPLPKATMDPALARAQVNEAIEQYLQRETKKARSGGFVRALVILVLLGGIGYGGYIKRDKLMALLDAYSDKAGVPLLLSVRTNPPTRVYLVKKDNADGPVDLGMSPVAKVKGAAVGDTVRLVNEDLGIELEKPLAVGQPNEVRVIDINFQTGELQVALSPPTKGLRIFRGARDMGIPSGRIKMYQGKYQLELRGDALTESERFEVEITPGELTSVTLDIRKKLAAPR